MSRRSFFIPLAVFALLAPFFVGGFYLNDAHDLPSTLIGKPFPEFRLPELSSGQLFDQSMLKGQVQLVNVWGSWCFVCRAEHRELERIAKEEGLAIVGVNYKDDPAAAQQWLAQLGNPYSSVIVDATGRLGIDLGVTGAPETFLVDANGDIRYKIIGEVTRQRWLKELKPLIDRLRGPA